MGDQLSGDDTIVSITLGAEHNATLAYALGLEFHHLIMSTFGAHKYQLERQGGRSIVDLMLRTGRHRPN